MKARYVTAEGVEGELECAVLIPITNDVLGSFTLLGFDSWEDHHDDKPCIGITGLAAFYLSRDNEHKVGF